MSGTITPLPPLVTPPSGATSGNPQVLSGVTYSFAYLGLPQTWLALQTFPLGTISINAGDITGGLGAGVSAWLATPSSANLLAALTDKTGTGTAVFSNSPTLVSPTLGAATATSLNRVAVTAPSSVATLTIADGKTLTASDNATVSGTNTGDQTITLTGDVTGSGAGSFAATISANAITNAKMATMAAYTLKGNATGASAAPTDIDVTALTLKATPASADIVLIQDSAASNAFKKTTVGAFTTAGSVSSFNGRTGAVTPAQGDYTANLIPGTTTNNNATAGNIGEYVFGQTLRASGVMLTSNTPANIVSISLTAGDWDVTGTLGYLPQATTATTNIGWIVSTTSATMGSLDSAGRGNFPSVAAGANDMLLPTPDCRISLSTTTTVYLVANVVFTSTAPSAYGSLRARRVR